MHSHLLEAGRSLLDFVFPPQCRACRRPLAQAGEQLCAACWAEIGAGQEGRCGRCSRPGPAEGEGCARCAGWDRSFERAVVWGAFRGAMQEAVHAAKFRQGKGLGREMGRRMGAALREGLAEVDLLVPVPLHPARRRERGYNQSALIARGLGQALQVEVVEGVLVRRRPTRQQARLEAGERRANVRGAFCVRGRLPEHGCVGLVDDVLTTGATLEEGALALGRAGAGRVWAVVLASPFS